MGLLIAQAQHFPDGRRAILVLSIILMAVVTVAYFACARWLKIERA